MSTDDDKKKLDFATWGPWAAMVAAVVLTAKGEFDLAVLAHFSPWVAPLFPVMIDVYVVASFHRRRMADMIISALLMISCQIAVHVTPIYITAGEATPWGLVVAVACIAPIVVVRVKTLTGRTAEEIAAEKQAALREDELRAARAETAEARRSLAEIEAAAAASADQAQAEIAARAEAETAVTQLAAQVENLTAQAAAEQEIAVGKQEEIQRQAREEIGRLEDAIRGAIAARDAAARHADEQTQAAGLAQGRLAEARDSAERAAAARAEAEQRAEAHMLQVSTAAEQAEHELRQQLAAATSAATAAERHAAELAEQVRTLIAQRDEARASAQRTGDRAVLAEQRIADLERNHDAALEANESLRRRLDRATEKKAEITAGRAVEISGRRQQEISGRADRKPELPALTGLPENLPVVESVRPEKVAAALIARAVYPDATLAQLSEITSISDRTIGKVLRAGPSDVAGETAKQLLALAAGGQVLALTEGRAA
jgi:hypothetical protein